MTRTPVQEAAFEKFGRLKVGALFMEQGSGKSRVVIDLLARNSDKLDAAVWVVPYSVKETIRTEADRWGCPVPIEVIGYETLSASDTAYLEALGLVRSQRTALIADESIFIKNADAKRTQRMLELRKYAGFALILNGTPITRDLWDLKRQIDFLDPRIIGMGDGEFRSRYFTTVRYRKATGQRGEFDKVYQPNVAHLMSLVDPYMLVADLDLGVRETHRIEQHAPSPEIAGKYDWLKKRVLDFYRVDGGSDMLRLLNRLSSLVANDPVKVRAVAQRITGRCVVFTSYLDETRLLGDTLGTPFVVVGETPHRDAVIDQWRASDEPLVITIGTGAFGLNLQDASTIHFASVGFDFARIAQAGKRIRRLGQQHDLTFVQHESTLGISRLIRDNLTNKDFLSQLVRRQIDLGAVL